MFKTISLIVASLSLLACSLNVTRNPVPKNKSSLAGIAKMPTQIRMWGDEKFPEKWVKAATEKFKQRIKLDAGENKIITLSPAHYLALSGGADDGAFGAGLLVGWTASGQRPQFNYVTGISTGALIAPFAFLGEKWDWVLREFYTKYSTDDIVILRNLLDILSADSVMDTKPLARLINKYVTKEVLDAIAVEYHKGRHLVIGTTHLDAQRPMLWNMGLIATSESPNALLLFRKIMMASSAVPTIFPPVYIDVEIEGQHFDEMHVDGGAMSQVVVFPPGIDIKDLLKRMGVERERHLYVVRNGRLKSEWENVEPDLLSIGNRSISTLIKSQGKNDLYEIWEMSKAQGITYHLASIPDDFNGKREEFFDKKYMKALFNHTYQLSKQGFEWKDKAPNVFSQIK